jgi:CheY-like chemotaxis protein
MFLDDDKRRHEEQGKLAIGHVTDRAYDAKKAIELLSTHVYDLVMLDHDLGGIEWENRLDAPEDGRTVARWMAQNPGRFESTRVVGHSLNYSGSREMVASLADGGIPAKSWPCAWLYENLFITQGDATQNA